MPKHVGVEMRCGCRGVCQQAREQSPKTVQLLHPQPAQPPYGQEGLDKHVGEGGPQQCELPMVEGEGRARTASRTGR